MEKFQIAKYGMMQVTAIVYGVLICSLGTKLARPAFEAGMPMNDGFYVAQFLRGYGIFFFLIPLGWTWCSAHESSLRYTWEFSEDKMISGAISFCLGFMLLTTFIAIFAAMSGQGDLLVGTPHH